MELVDYLEAIRHQEGWRCGYNPFELVGQCQLVNERFSLTLAWSILSNKISKK
jgi:hypothetical protein